MHDTPTSSFNLESPAGGSSLPAGRQQLRGWLVPKPGHHFTDVRGRVGARIFPGVYGFPRADLAAHFEPTRPWLPAEFTVAIDFRPGPTTVELEALTLAGQWQGFHSVNFEIQATLPPAQPAPDPVSAGELGRLLQHWLASESASATAIAAELPYPRIVRPAHTPFHGYLVEPAGIAPALYGQMDVVGWLFHETQPIKRAFASTDLIAFQELATGGEFAGVRARYPDLPHAGNCRLAGFVDVSSRLPPPVSVRIFAELADGSTHLCLVVQCRPLSTEETKKSCAPFGLWKFWQGWRALQRALAERGASLDDGAALRREFWATRRRCRQLVGPHPGSTGVTPPALPPAAAGRPLRLLLITHNLNLEGAPLLFVEYARHLVTQGSAQVCVLAGSDGPLRAAFTALGATVTIVDVSANTPAELRQQINTIGQAVDWQNTDLVVANTLASFWGVPLARSAGRPALLYIHESTTPAVFFQRTTPALLPVVQEAFRTAAAVSFNTAATAAYYAGLGSGRNYHFNSAWIDLAALESFQANHPRAVLRESLGLKSDELLVANIGTVCERKGQHDFLRAIAWLRRLDPGLAARCRFVMVGGRSTRYNQALRRNLAALGGPNVAIVPETAHALDYFGAADLFVCTSYEESFPRVVLEAMAFAVPIVSTDVHGIPSMLRHGEEAILVAPGDLDGLTTAMLLLLDNPTAAKLLALRAQARVTEFAASTVLPRHADFTARVAALRA